jgi:hypothetical protein
MIRSHITWIDLDLDQALATPKNANSMNPTVHLTCSSNLHQWLLAPASEDFWTVLSVESTHKKRILEPGCLPSAYQSPPMNSNKSIESDSTLNLQQHWRVCSKNDEHIGKLEDVRTKTSTLMYTTVYEFVETAPQRQKSFSVGCGAHREHTALELRVI